MNKKIQIPITEEDIRMFQELVHYDRESFTWTFDGIDVEFVKDEEEMQSMISHELAQIWITSDGKRFLTKNEAVKHEESIQPTITEKWLDKIKGE